ncbi:putative leucine--tRNA ligase, mitochondrial [Amphibalanus amphitrite]|uniref:leucine--tRNA ligase n=1 Tax=Amphibalanus amphitrite TaxID=1232801 RepID=A0A6A4VBV7_AMPAM|nr:putative leucine--tRNA ligase, mitochondrial [Amphibalanus amphitrite]KAF0290620.1 putative leucine--tRNA ligase, mitochondrial [Amphibalanus amphitrite]
MALRCRWSVRRWAARLAAARRPLFTETGVWEELTDAERLAAERRWLDVVSEPGSAARPDVEHTGSAYVLAMFPYPSGRLHMGHVVHPMGWDAFGLPAENAALERGLAPDRWTRQNIEHMRGQLRRMAAAFDWDRELATCQPDYYRWTQWLFLRLHRAGLVYRRQALVNWDPADGTVLADEQVDARGRSWRSGALVERRLLRQWFVRTTRFSERLLRSLDSPELRDWRDVIQLQRHWIGPCDGWRFELQVERCAPDDSAPPPEPLLLWVADPARLPAAAFIALRPEHPLAAGAAERTGLAARCPASGRRLPLLVSARLAYPEGADALLCDAADGPEAARLAGLLAEDGRPPPGPPLTAAEVVARGGGYRCSSHLHDWLISRQRYWGTPIPVVHCARCGAVPLPESRLPVTLPALPEQRVPGRSPLQAATDWLNTQCPSCGGPAQRETDTMDTFVDSSWYYLRFLDARHERAPFRPQRVNRHLPVDIYVGGKEHDSGDVVCAEDGRPVTVQWEKMSKSKHNGVDPAGVMDQLGADTMRLLMLATVAPTSSRRWSQDTFPPLLAWQRRLWLTVGELVRPAAGASAPSAAELARHEADMREERNYFVRTVTHNFQETHQLSVAISRLQGLTTALRRRPAWYRALGGEYQRALGDLIIMCSPVMPCLCAEMWAGFCAASRHSHPEHRLDLTVMQQRWPAVDADALLELVVELNGQQASVCLSPSLTASPGVGRQLNGQQAATVCLPRRQLDALTEVEALRLARAQPALARHAAGAAAAGQLLLQPGLGAVLRLSTEHRRPPDDDDPARREVLRQRQERKAAKKERREQRRLRKAEREER